MLLDYYRYFRKNQKNLKKVKIIKKKNKIGVNNNKIQLKL